MDLKGFQLLEFINSRLSNIEKNIARLEEKMDFSLSLQRNHLVRIKNGEEIDDNMVLMGRPYNDLTPLKAYNIYNNPDIDFILLDVSHKTYVPPKRPKDAIHIPLEELASRYLEIQSRTLPILVLSEKGLRSIQACELMVKKGYFNVNNISASY